MPNIFVKPAFHGMVTISTSAPLTGPGSAEDIISKAREFALEGDIKYAEEVSDYTGWICASDEIGSNNGFFESVADLRHWCQYNGVEIPEFAFCCYSEIPQLLDYDELLDEQVFVDSFEDARDWVGLEAGNAFRDAIDKFNEHVSSILTYYADKRKKVRVRPL